MSLAEDTRDSDDQVAQDPVALIAALGEAARTAGAELGNVSTDRKNRALEAAAAHLRTTLGDIGEANRLDMEAGREAGLSAAKLDRLALDEERIEGIAKGLEDVAGLDDPVGAVMAEWQRPNGLGISRVRVPLGVIGIIYESRPNVTADAGALSLKAGNAAILRVARKAFIPTAPSSPACRPDWPPPYCRPAPSSSCPPATAPPSAPCCGPMS